MQRKLKYLEEQPKKIDLICGNVMVDFSVIRDAPLGLMNNGENVLFCYAGAIFVTIVRRAM